MFNSNMLPDEMNMSKEEVVFKIHTKGYIKYDPLRYVNGSISCVCAFTNDKDVFPRCLDHIMSEIDEPKWAILYYIPNKSLEKYLKLLHTDSDVHSFFYAAVKNDSTHLYVAHKKQNLGKYYYKNMEWEEEDDGLRCSSSTPFTTRFIRKISKRNMIGLRKKVKTGVIHDEGADRKTKKTLVNRGNKGKEKVFEDDSANRKTKKTLVNGGNNGKEKVFEDEGSDRKTKKTLVNRAMVNGKAKMVEGGKGQRYNPLRKVMYFYTNFRSNISQGDCFIPFDIKQSFSRLVNLLEMKQHVLTSVKEIENV
ncbi:hypothetical protein Tco_0563846 [Tanacetum coccineum]